MHISSVLYSLVFPGLALGRPPVKLRTTPSSVGSYDWSPRTVISTPDESGFFNATERWTVYRAPSFNLEISPATEEDVITAVSISPPYSLYPCILRDNRPKNCCRASYQN
jgi:hypothetical protein